MAIYALRVMSPAALEPHARCAPRVQRCATDDLRVADGLWLVRPRASCRGGLLTRSKQVRRSRRLSKLLTARTCVMMTK